MTTLADKCLVTPPINAAPAAVETIVDIARRYGVSPITQMREWAVLRMARGKLDSHEYYTTGAFRPDQTMEQKKEYVGHTSSFRVNEACSPLKLTEIRAFVRDKLPYSELLRQYGIPVTETQAVMHTGRFFGRIPTLRTPEDVKAFLRNDARYPLFAKPVEGRESVGSARIDAIGADGRDLHLGNGKVVDLDVFVREIVQDYPEGYIFQTAIHQHEALSAITGPIIGTMRYITIWDGDWPRLLYAVWKIPAPGAMSDNYWQSGSLVGKLERETGKLLGVRRGMAHQIEDLTEHPVSGASFDGFVFPHWQEIERVACDAHAIFPEFGLVGWDMAVGPDGPIIVEANDNPFHNLYQITHDRGVRHPEMDEVFARAAARTQGILRTKIDAYQARKRVRAGRA
jgi:hypothetical protein